MRKRARRCCYCGEVAGLYHELNQVWQGTPDEASRTRILQYGRNLCVSCIGKLSAGKEPYLHRPFTGDGGCGYGAMDDNPWQQNAIKEWEEGGSR